MYATDVGAPGRDDAKLLLGLVYAIVIRCFCTAYTDVAKPAASAGHRKSSASFSAGFSWSGQKEQPGQSTSET